MIGLDVRGKGRALTPAARARLLKRLARAMRAAGIGREVDVSLSLVDDEEITGLNREYREEDRPTDVLSFSQREGGERPAPGAPDLLGDIVISIETAARQAAERGVELEEELLHLSVHGLAHLLGYDHVSEREEREMFGWETRLRDQALGRGAVVAIPRP